MGKCFFIILIPKTCTLKKLYAPLHHQTLKHKTTMKKQHRSLRTIAYEIKSDWKNVYFGAEPYLNAMSTMDTINDRYGMDSGKGIVAYFLGNASTWKGEIARNIKKELNAMLK